MDFNMFYIFVSLLLVSVGASNYEQGPRKFYEVSSNLMTAEQNENKEVILYLTPEQVKSLEENGAVVRSSENPENEEYDAGLAEPQVNEDQSEEAEQDDDEATQQEVEAQEDETQEEEAQDTEVQEDDVEEEGQEQEISEDNLDIDFDEILRIINEEVEEEEAAADLAVEQVLNEPQVEEDKTESPRNFSPRITLRQQQQQQEQRYVAPIAKKNQESKSLSYLRYQPNVEAQRINFQYLQQQQVEVNNAEESNEEVPVGSNNQERKKYKLIPYDVEGNSEGSTEEENPEEQGQQNPQADNVQNLSGAQTLDAGRLNNVISQKKNRQNEVRLQNILRGLKASPKQKDRKYAFEIEKLMDKLQKLNVPFKGKSVTKFTPALLMQEINKNRRFNNFAKQGNAPARDVEGESRQSKFRKSSAPAENLRANRVPVIKAKKSEVQRPISKKNINNKTKTSKASFIVSRKASQAKRQNRVEVPKSKPERITILRRE